MKKSRIIVPAMAVIAFSSAASIAGSVAWFTASRQVTISGGSYAVVKTNSNLEMELTKGAGTTVNGTTVTFTGKLTDASFNHGNSTVYWSNGAAKAEDLAVAGNVAFASYSDDDDLAAALVRKTLAGNVKVYSAATFHVKFTMDIGSGEPNIALYLNHVPTTGSSFAPTSGDPLTANGFRMALIPSDATLPTGCVASAKVFGHYRASNVAKYVSGTDNVNGSAYNPLTTFIGSDNTDAMPAEGAYTQTQAAARSEYLCTFSGEGRIDINYTVVAWFEGTDSSIVNQEHLTDYQTVVSSLVFDAVGLSASNS